MLPRGLTFKLSVLLACIGVLASGATGYYAYRANRTMLVNEAEHSLQTSTELLGQRIAVSIDDVAADALVLATLPSSESVAQTDDGVGPSAGRERLAQVYSSFMLHHPEYLQIRLITRQHHGLELIRFDRDSDGLVRVQGDDLQEKGQFAYGITVADQLDQRRHGGEDQRRDDFQQNAGQRALTGGRTPEIG